MSSKPFFTCEIPVRWGDMDAFGHVNNTLYFKYFEEARFLAMLHHGMPTIAEVYPVVVTIGATFLRPLFHPDTLTIEMYLSEPGRSSFMVNYKVYSSAAPNEVAAEGYSKVVWVHQKDGRSVPMPDNVRTWFD